VVEAIRHLGGEVLIDDPAPVPPLTPAPAPPPPPGAAVAQESSAMFSPRIHADAKPETPAAPSVVLALRAAGGPDLDPAGSDLDPGGPGAGAAPREPDFDYPATAAATAVASAGGTGPRVAAVSRQNIYGEVLTAGSSALAPAPAQRPAPSPRHLSVAPDPEASAGGHYGSIPRVPAQSVESGLAAMGLRARPGGGAPPEPEPEPEAETELTSGQNPIFERTEPHGVPARPVIPPAPAPSFTSSAVFDAAVAESAPPAPPVAPLERLGVRFTPTAPPASVTTSAAPAHAPIPAAAPAPAPTSIQSGPAYFPGKGSGLTPEPGPGPERFAAPVRPAPAPVDPLMAPVRLATTPAAFAPRPAPVDPSPAAPTPAVDPLAYELPATEPAEDPREILRAATQKAVDRLVRPEPVMAPPVVAAPPAATVLTPGTHPVSGSQPVSGIHSDPAVSPAPGAELHGPGTRPSIAELTRQVERAVTDAAVTERYHREIAEKARALAAQILSDAVDEAQHTTERAAAERDSVLAAAQAEAEKIHSDARAEAEKVLSDSRAAADKLVSDGQAEHDEQLARAHSHSTAIIAHAEVELGRRVRRIAELTDGITDVAEATLGRLASGTLTGTQLAQFITTLGTVTERALEHLEHSELAATAPVPGAGSEAQTTTDDGTDADL
jgi:F0F1-type ATP synthase membrane subunit b/b'